jgi:hypothetical protein
VGRSSNFDDPRISGAIKDYVKAEPRVVEDFISGAFLAFTRRMAYPKDSHLRKRAAT